MGYMRHHAIIVSSYSEERIAPAHTTARDLFADTHAHVSNVTPPAMNGYVSFFVAPDGSKEWWPDSDRAEAARNAFVEWLERQRFEDASSWLDWVEVQFGDDEGDTRVTRGDDVTAEAES